MKSEVVQCNSSVINHVIFLQLLPKGNMELYLITSNCVIIKTGPSLLSQMKEEEVLLLHNYYSLT
jgi:hypothetical protein